MLPAAPELPGAAFLLADLKLPGKVRTNKSTAEAAK